MAVLKKALYNCFKIIFLISLIHYFITNPLEKAIVYTTVANTEDIRRPEKYCHGVSSLQCIGMPSGHSEIAVIVCAFLWKLNVLRIDVAAAIILLVGAQRIYADRHSVAQVLTGFGSGSLYATLYLFLYSRYSIMTALTVAVVIPVVASVILTVNINAKLSEPTPAWVDPTLLSIIDKKKNASYFNKYMQTIAPVGESRLALYYSWKQVEEKGDMLISKLKNRSFDIIVGIKTGGAILASYMHSKMTDKKLYFVKSKSDKSENPLVIAYERGIINKRYKTDLVEGIDDDISNKTVLLVDETISSGQTILFIKKYLEELKNVKHIIIATIDVRSTVFKHIEIDDYDSVYCSKTEYVAVWPWGYDN